MSIPEIQLHCVDDAADNDGSRRVGSSIGSFLAPFSGLQKRTPQFCGYIVQEMRLENISDPEESKIRLRELVVGQGR